MFNFNPKQLLQAVMKSADPNRAFMQMAQTNPVLQQAMQMTNGKTPDQIRDMAREIARQRGIDLDSFIRELGINLPK